MIVRKLSLAAAVSLSLAGMSSVSHALGLGEIEMYSALNQTLDAEIAILSATDSELEEMQVRLASSDAFARAGLEQSPILDTVEFTVDRRPDGQAVVKVTSDSPIFEPFLNFLLEVDAPGSVKLVREYTVLLSPPTFADNGAVGEPIDLSGKTLFEGNDTGAEVSFTETTIGTFIEPNVTTTIADADTENLFLPEDNILTELPADTTTTDSDSDSDSDSLLTSLSKQRVHRHKGHFAHREQHTPQQEWRTWPSASLHLSVWKRQDRPAARKALYAT